MRITAGVLPPLAALALGLAVQPAAAQSFEEIDALSDAAQDERTGIRSAQTLAAQGAYLEALATLERMLDGSWWG